MTAMEWYIQQLDLARRLLRRRLSLSKGAADALVFTQAGSPYRQGKKEYLRGGAHPRAQRIEEERAQVLLKWERQIPPMFAVLHKEYAVRDSAEFHARLGY